MLSENSVKKECSCSNVLPRLCEPIWFMNEPFADSIKSLTQRQITLTCDRKTRNSQKNKYHTSCPMLNQLEICLECGPKDFEYYKSNNIPTWYLCKEIFNGHMYPCGHFKTDHFFNCQCTFCHYHQCCQQPQSNVCWSCLGYGTTDDI